MKDSCAIRCQYTKLVPVGELKPNPKNPNTHTPAQIKRLAEVIKFQGVRKPIVVSNQSDLIVTGHGTLESLKLLKMKKVPVDYQDFESPDSEYAHMVADNALQQWSDLDLSQINKELENLGPDMGIDMMGIKEFSLDPEFKPGTEDEQGKLDETKTKIMECPHCNERFEEKQAKVIN